MSNRNEMTRMAGEVFERGVLRLTTLQMPGRAVLSEVEIIEQIPVGLIDPSPNNRAEFDEQKMGEMVASLREHGQTTAAIVRPRAEGRYELVAGERRWRGCQMAGISTLSCVVRGYSDSQAAEILLIENLEREDLKPSEEARIYQKLLDLRDEAGERMFSLQKIALRVHNDIKKVNRVSLVLTILNLPPVLKKALDQDLVSLRVAYLVARIADVEDRQVAAKVVLEGQWGEGPMTLQKAHEFISQRFQVSLKGSKLDRDDAELLSPEVKQDLGYTGAVGQANDGSCTRCPWLAKNHEVYRHELSGHVKERGAGIDPMTCTRARCHEMKLDALWQRMAVGFAERHKAGRILTREESRLVGGMRGEWVLLTQKPDWQDVGDWDTAQQSPPWERLIKGAGVPLAVACGGAATGDDMQPVLVAERVLALEAARKAHPELFANAEVEGQTNAVAVMSDEEREAARTREMEREVALAVATRVRREGLLELLTSVQEKGLGVDGMRGFFDSISRNVDKINDVAGLVLSEVDGEDDYPETRMRELLTAASPNEVLAMCVVASVIDDVTWSGVERAEDFRAICAAQGIDVEGLKKRVEKDVRKKLTAERAEAAAREQEEVQRANRQEREEIEKRTILEGGERKAMPEAEEVAWQCYERTGSIKEAAAAAGVAVDTVKNWHKRRGWAAKSGAA
jgi:ParB/RepB/Spo0J family partition protein